MKKILSILPFLILMLCSQSCTKTKIPTIEGEWKLTSPFGNYWGGEIPPNFDKLKIDSDLNFVITNNDTVLIQGIIEELEYEFCEFKIKLVPEVVISDEYFDLLDNQGKCVELEESKLTLKPLSFHSYNIDFVRIR